MKKMIKLIMLITMTLSLSMLTGCFSFFLAETDDDNKESSQVAETREPRERPVPRERQQSTKPQKKPVPRKRPIRPREGSGNNCTGNTCNANGSGNCNGSTCNANNSSNCSGGACNVTSPNNSNGNKTPNDFLAEIKNFGFATVDLNGRTVTSDIFKNYDVTMMVLWLSGCGRCRREMPNAQMIYEQYKSKNCNVLAVLIDYPINSAKIRRAKDVLNTAGARFKCLKSNGDFMPLLRHISPVPVVLFFDRNGNVIAENGNDIFAGVVATKDALSQAMDKALRAVSR